MFENAKILTLIPDQISKGGSKTAVPSQAQNLDTRITTGCYVFEGRWRKDSLAIVPAAPFDTLVPDPNAGSSIVLHPYYWLKTPLTDPQASSNIWILAHNQRIDPAISGTGDIAAGSATISNLTGHVFTNADIGFSMDIPASYPSTTPILVVIVQVLAANQVVVNTPLTVTAVGTVYSIYPSYEIFNHTTGTTMEFAALSVPATFLNIKNRCHIAWGFRQSFIVDGNAPTGFQAYDVGVNPPVTVPTYALSSSTTGTAVVTQNSPYIVRETGTAWNGGSFTPPKTIVLAGTTFTTNTYSGADPGHPGTLTTTGTNQGTISAVWQTGGLYNGLVVTHVASGDNARVSDYYVKGGITYVTFRTVFPAHAAVAYTVAGSPGSVGSDRFVLNGNYTGISAWSAPFVLYTGSLFWAGPGPKYAYAYYDNRTGHISNISPIQTVTEQNQNNINVTLTGISGSPDLRFGYVKIFRSLLNGGTTLLPLTQGAAGTPADLLFNYQGTGTFVNGNTAVTNITPPIIGTFSSFGNNASVLTIGPDSKALAYPAGNTGTTITLAAGGWPGSSGVQQFTVSGGSIGLAVGTGFVDSYPDSTLTLDASAVAPQLTNNKPPVFLRHIYWFGRVWGVPLTDPSAIRYSADQYQVPFGVPEESFPAQNILRVPSDDGNILGFKLFGNQIIITTQRYAYTIVGSSPSNFQVMRFATTMYGVGDYMMSEFPGDTGETSDSIVYLGLDRKLYIMAPGYGNVQLSDPVQADFDALGNTDHLQRTHVHNFRVGGRRGVYVSSPNNVVYVYDFDKKTWTSNPLRTTSNIAGNGVGPRAGCTVYQGTTPVVELAGFGGNIRQWLYDAAANVVTVASIQTAPIDFGRKSLKRLHAVRIYVSDVGSLSYSLGSMNTTNGNATVIINNASAPFAYFSQGDVGSVLTTIGALNGPFTITTVIDSITATVSPAPNANALVTFTKSGGNAPWRGSVIVNETTTYGNLSTTGAFQAYSDQILTEQPTGSVGVDASGAKELLWLPSVVASKPIIGYRFDLTVQFPQSFTPEDLYKVQMIYSDELDPGQEAL